MKRIFLLLLACGVACSAFAEDSGIRIVFKDGRIQNTPALSISQDTLFATISDEKGVKGRIGYPAAAIARLEIPEPSALTSARVLLREGRAAEALRLIIPVEVEQAPLFDIAGNWWAPAALLKAEALIALGKNSEAKALLERLGKVENDPENLLKVRLRQAEIALTAGEVDRALAVFDQCIAESSRPEILAPAWKGRGDVLAKRRDYDPALLAYLRVPIFFSSQSAEVRASQLGAGHALLALGHRQEAMAQLERLSTEFPDSAEARTAHAEIERLEKNPSIDTSPTP